MGWDVIGYFLDENKFCCVSEVGGTWSSWSGDWAFYVHDGMFFSCAWMVVCLTAAGSLYVRHGLEMCVNWFMGHSHFLYGFEEAIRWLSSWHGSQVVESAYLISCAWWKVEKLDCERGFGIDSSSIFFAARGCGNSVWIGFCYAVDWGCRVSSSIVSLWDGVLEMWSNCWALNFVFAMLAGRTHFVQLIMW